MISNAAHQPRSVFLITPRLGLKICLLSWGRDFNRPKRTYNPTRLLAICFDCGLETSILIIVRGKDSFELYSSALFLNPELIMSGKKADLNEKQIFVRNLPFDVTAEVRPTFFVHSCSSS